MYYYDTARLASHFVDIHERWTKFHDSTPSTKLINARKLEQTFEAFRRISKFQRIEKSNSSSRKKGFKSASRELPKDLRIFLVSRNRRTSFVRLDRHSSPPPSIRNANRRRRRRRNNNGPSATKVTRERVGKREGEEVEGETNRADEG